MSEQELYGSIRELVVAAREKTLRAVNVLLLQTYWEIGKLIVEEERSGKARGRYSDRILKNVSGKLEREFGSGYAERSLRNMKAFHLAFPIRSALRTELSWTHYRLISRVVNEKARKFYMEECVSGGWSSRTLERNISSGYFERIKALPTPKDGVPPPDARAFIKDPYIFEFLGLSAEQVPAEKDLETALLKHLHQFLMELGKGFAFVARQQHLSTETGDFYVDLVFYNYYLKCFVLIDLKKGRLTHQDIGQMDMYVRMYEDLKRAPDDNPTIGIILCTEKDETVVKYSVLSGSNHLFASKYRLYLPEENDLKQLIEHDRLLFEMENRKQERGP
ncbi:MAG: PDDEXK nuclease domain-containing protein [Chitinophagaceae bacterium]